MLRQKTLVEVMGKVNTDGVQGAMLFNREGVLMAYNGYGESNANVSSALLASIWESFDRRGGRNDLDEVMMVYEDGILAVSKVANMLLALKASGETQPGLIRAKLASLRDFLDAPMNVVSKNLL